MTTRPLLCFQNLVTFSFALHLPNDVCHSCSKMPNFKASARFNHELLCTCQKPFHQMCQQCSTWLSHDKVTLDRCSCCMLIQNLVHLCAAKSPKQFKLVGCIEFCRSANQHMCFIFVEVGCTLTLNVLGSTIMTADHNFHANQSHPVEM